MTVMSLNPLLAGLKPTHPGEILREDVLPALRLSKVEAARLLRVSRTQLYKILDGRQSLSPQMALRIARLTGGEPEFWMALQAAHDLRIARDEIAAELAQIPTVERPADAA